MASWIAGGIVLVVVGLILYKLWHDKHTGKGGCSCGGGCNGCSGCGGCGMDKN